MSTSFLTRPQHRERYAPTALHEAVLPVLALPANAVCIHINHSNRWPGTNADRFLRDDAEFKFGTHTTSYTKYVMLQSCSDRPVQFAQDTKPQDVLHKAQIINDSLLKPHLLRVGAGSVTSASNQLSN